MADNILPLGCVYRLTFPNGKAYIGITKRTAEKRFAAHVQYSVGKKRKFAVHSAILRFGADSVVVETLAFAPWSELAALEIKAIAEHGTRAPNGYNLTRGGDGVVDFDDITRAKMGEANIGRVPSAETRAKLSIAGSGRLHTDDAKRKISEARAGMKFSDEHRTNLSSARERSIANGYKFVMSEQHKEKIRASKLGKPRSAETKQKLSDANKGKTHSQESRAKRSASGVIAWVKRREAMLLTAQ